MLRNSSESHDFLLLLHLKKKITSLARILCIDYGRKRCGIAVTDPLGIAANGLPTIPTHELCKFLTDYCSREVVERIVIGKPMQLNGAPSESMKYITPFVARLRKLMPEMPVVFFDERFTSTIAHREMIAAGLPKHRRQEKGLADKTAAVLILTGYLDSLSCS